MIPSSIEDVRPFFLGLLGEQSADPLWVAATEALVDKIEDAYPMEPDFSPVEKLFGQILFKLGNKGLSLDIV